MGYILSEDGEMYKFLMFTPFGNICLVGIYIMTSVVTLQPGIYSSIATFIGMQAAFVTNIIAPLLGYSSQGRKEKQKEKKRKSKKYHMNNKLLSHNKHLYISSFH